MKVIWLGLKWLVGNRLYDLKKTEEKQRMDGKAFSDAVRNI